VSQSRQKQIRPQLPVTFANSGQGRTLQGRMTQYQLLLATFLSFGFVVHF